MHLRHAATFCFALVAASTAAAGESALVGDEPVYVPMNMLLFPSFEGDWGPWSRAGGADRVSDGRARTGEWCFHAPAQSTITGQAGRRGQFALRRRHPGSVALAAAAS